MALMPEKSMKACVAGRVRCSHYLPVIVQAGSINPVEFTVSAKVSQVHCLSVPPQDSMKRSEIVLRNRIERAAFSGGAHSFAKIVDGVSNSVRIAGNGGKLQDAYL